MTRTAPAIRLHPSGRWNIGAFSQKQNQAEKSASPSPAWSHDEHGSGYRVHPILHLQRAIGNQAVQRMLHRHAEDRNLGSTAVVSYGGHGPAPIQTKLAINRPGDEYEQEAERVSEQVMRTPETQFERPCACGGACAECSKKQDAGLQAKLKNGEPPLTRQAPGVSSEQSDAAPASVSHTLASPGSPLEPVLRQNMEQRFGYDFSGVRVHADAAAEESASDVNARAYTVGHNIVFGAGQYAPGCSEGQRLIAHELTHVIQQGSCRETAARAVLQRTPEPPEKGEECKIRNPRAFIYFEIFRRFKDPDDPELVKRAHCLKEAFRMLSAADAVEFALQIMQQGAIYPAYERLATPTRVAIAEILADILKRSNTETYLARLLYAEGGLPDTPKSEQPAIVTSKVSADQLLQITLDKEVIAAAAVKLLGASECDQYTFGFTQFVTDDYFMAEYYHDSLKKYMSMDYGVNMKPLLPCQDVQHDGDVWTYSERLDCKSKQAIKKFSDAHFLIFEDIPSEGLLLFSSKPELFLTGVSWTDKFVTVLSVLLPNGVVHHISWFDWRIDYCENFSPTAAGQASIGKPPKDLSRRQVVTIHGFHSGTPPFAFVSQIGKPAGKACNTIVHSVSGKPDIVFHDSPLIGCGKP